MIRGHRLALAGVFAAAAAGITAAPAIADTVGLGVDFPAVTGGNCTSPIFCYDTSVIGYEFTANSDASVVGLGFFDDGSIDILDNASEIVGLWDTTDDQLVAFATIDASNATQVGTNWAFTALTSAVTLQEGDTYIVGAEGALPTYYYVGQIGITMDPQITYVDDVSTNLTNAAGPTEPNADTSSNALTSAGDAGYFGGNIELADPSDPTDPPDPIPEPMSLALFGAALAGLGLLRRRRPA